MMHVGAAAARASGAGPQHSSHSFHGAWATDAMAARRWNSGGAILPGSDADARVDVGWVGRGGWQDESYP